MKILIGVALGLGAFLLVRKVSGESLLNRAMANCYRDGVRNPDWYR